MQYNLAEMWVIFTVLG